LGAAVLIEVGTGVALPRALDGRPVGASVTSDVGEPAIPVGLAFDAPGDGAEVTCPTGLPTGALVGEGPGGWVVPREGTGYSWPMVLEGPVVGELVSPVGDNVSSELGVGLLGSDSVVAYVETGEGTGVPWVREPVGSAELP
jgi:hypothetical protein